MVRIASYDSWKYVEVWKVTEYRNGAVYKTKFLGYAKKEREKKSDEVYSAISTSKTKGQDEIELWPVLE